ncbi:fimbrial protein [Edwardsiella tarda]|uniref:fimbrial protein n=1 Tax=Edwardsiella tarda TaxID=636 RepID=UPI0011B23881|nr:fimbrial protein [Edwardsiella tarda]UCQ26592.1 fimbrial protein [Edwardsiella tarda]
MKFTKIHRTAGLARAGICLGLYGLSLLPFTTQAASTATVTVTATFVTATCDITVPATVWLGTLTPGAAKKHSVLKIDWVCDAAGQPLKTALKATPITGVLNATQDKLEMIVAGVQNGTHLWLEDPLGHAIKLTGHDSDIFCSGEGVSARSCELTPVTEVHSGDTFGMANAAIRFEVVYP